MKNINWEEVRINIAAYAMIGAAVVGVPTIAVGSFVGLQCSRHATSIHRDALIAPVCEAMGIEKGAVINTVADHVQNNLDQIGK